VPDVAGGAGTSPRAVAQGATGPLLRTPVAVVVSRFPLVTETFVLRELIELERLGQPVVLVPLLRERPPVVHREAVPWVGRALYTPFLSPAIVAANARCLGRRPRAYLGVLGALVRGNVRSANMLLRTLALFPKVVYLAERLARDGVGHVHGHFATHPGMAAWAIGRLSGIPYSLTAHAHDIFVRQDMLEAKLAGARFVRCVSEFNRKLLAARYPRQQPLLCVLHVGVALPSVDDAPRAASVPRLLCVAALKPYKGHAVLLRACARLRARGVAFECDLVGDGPLRAKLEAAVTAAGLQDHVHLLGAKTQDEVARRVASASVVVQPSVVAADGQMDGIPVALMEAMAARKPVVASALSGVPELVEDGVSGVLVPAGDADALAEAVERLLTQPPVARWMGEQAHRKVAHEFELGDTVRALLAEIDRHCHPVSPTWEQRLRAAGLAWPALGVRRLHERPESTVAELLLPEADAEAQATPRDLVLKIHHPAGGAPSSRTARHEFQTLALLASRLAEATDDGIALGTPRPLGLDEAEGALLMEACPGRLLEERVCAARWSARGCHRDACEDVRRTGAWLRAFQQRTAGDDPPALLSGLVEAAQVDLAAARLPRRFAARVSRRLETLAGRVRPESLTSAGQHSDFWPGNVFVGERSVHVVDFEGYQRGPRYEDAAYFLVQLGLFYAYPLLGGRRRALAAAFLDGYLRGAPLDRAAWALCWTAKVLQVLARPAAGTRGFVRRRWRRRALLSMLEREP